MMKKTLMAILLFCVAVMSGGCVQEALVVPVAVVNGKIVVPPGQVPLGVKITVAGMSSAVAYAGDSGKYSIELRKSGRFLLIAHGRDFDAGYAWVDVELEKTVDAPDISLSGKIVGEALWVASIVDFPDATGFNIKSVDPVWSPASATMYDDGSHGDLLANDGIYALRLTNLTTGSQQYSLEYTKADGALETKLDPHRENTRNGYSEIYVLESTVKLARGYVTSDLNSVDYSKVKLATKKGSRSMYLNTDGGYSFAMEGNGREYLVFRSPDFHIRAIPIDLSTVTLYDVPTTTLSSKRSGELKVVLVASDFADVSNPTVVGSFKGWSNPQALYDDATHGDDVAGDGVYTCLFTGIAPGTYEYAFNINSENQVKDPYQESGNSTYSIIEVKQ
ncbi:MAG: hypothetical protein A2W80_12420 [Candidatus Riflebacteria bacterium GWC2_50_8]|nr:MAG: hypothetical protein A2W80_12420 [Candidatus Riflebacteria bacterium GWC2_50_8]